jgi:hypothetical protein
MINQNCGKRLGKSLGNGFFPNKVFPRHTSACSPARAEFLKITGLNRGEPDQCSGYYAARRQIGSGSNSGGSAEFLKITGLNRGEPDQCSGYYAARRQIGWGSISGGCVRH